MSNEDALTEVIKNQKMKVEVSKTSLEKDKKIDEYTEQSLPAKKQLRGVASSSLITPGHDSGAITSAATL